MKTVTMTIEPENVNELICCTKCINKDSTKKLKLNCFNFIEAMKIIGLPDCSKNDLVYVKVVTE